MSFEIAKITGFVETLIFALRVTLKRELEESALQPCVSFCAAARRIALQSLPNPTEKPDFKENVENLNTLRNDSFALVLTAFLYTGIFEAISGDFEHCSSKTKCIRKTAERN